MQPDSKMKSIKHVGQRWQDLTGYITILQNNGQVFDYYVMRRQNPIPIGQWQFALVLAETHSESKLDYEPKVVSVIACETYVDACMELARYESSRNASY